MVIKVYISGISGNKEVKKRQQRVLLILDSKYVKYEVIDIAEPGAEESKDFMQANSTGHGGTISDPNPRHPLPPQIYNNDVYCGDYDMFDMANEIDEMETFLKLEANDLAKEQTSTAAINLKNGDLVTEEPEEKLVEKDLKENEVPDQQVAEEKVEEMESKLNNEEKKEELEEEIGSGDRQTENGKTSKEEIELKEDDLELTENDLDLKDDLVEKADE